ncbi:phage tail protein I [Pseudomonas rhizoryzae]|uniref:phage tail protein I n=1 Tax=Pseudomonas rhizoryzae TaxID=2571129 RepID=UPI000736F710|nr:phage tail protein I [Pseudomonas rhizoryzae]KTT25133.1 phage tail protein [Pseudomonas psychrotolerans]KTT33521.1 phage tail protein [Pseudomonas psychrotolerans]KTT73241.1 phage tail protein [Pseudomonas psychrotolerans]
MRDLLPPNSTHLERRLAQVGSAISDVPVPTRSVWNPDTAPAEQLPWLAWALSVDAWDPLWSENQKRQTIRASLQVHRSKGTFGAIKDALAALGYPLRVQEWYQQTPPGQPGTFRLLIEVDQVGVPNSSAERFLAVVEAAKNLRSHLDTIELHVASRNRRYRAAVTMAGFELTLRPSDLQYAVLEPGFVEAEFGLHQLTNVDLVQALELKNG